MEAVCPSEYWRPEFVPGYFGCSEQLTRPGQSPRPAWDWLPHATDVDPATWLARTRSLDDIQPRSIAWEVSAVAGLCSVDDPAVINFLLEHGQLPVLILEACWRLRRLLGSDASVRLRLSHDPEEGRDDLFLTIVADADIDKSYAALDRFDQEWFLNVPLPLKERFGVTVG